MKKTDKYDNIKLKTCKVKETANGTKNWPTKSEKVLVATSLIDN